MNPGRYNGQDIHGSNVFYVAADPDNWPEINMNFVRGFGDDISFSMIVLRSDGTSNVYKAVGDRFQFTDGVVYGGGSAGRGQIGLLINSSDTYLKDITFREIGQVSVYYGTDMSNSGRHENGYSENLRFFRCYGACIQFNPHTSTDRWLRGYYYIRDYYAEDCGYANDGTRPDSEFRHVISLAPDRRYNSLYATVEVVNGKSVRCYGGIKVQESGNAKYKIHHNTSENDISNGMQNHSDQTVVGDGKVEWWDNVVTGTQQGPGWNGSNDGGYFEWNNSWNTGYKPTPVPPIPGSNDNPIPPMPQPDPEPTPEPDPLPNPHPLPTPKDPTITLAAFPGVVEIFIQNNDAVLPSQWQIKVDDPVLVDKERIIERISGTATKYVVTEVEPGKRCYYVTGEWIKYGGIPDNDKYPSSTVSCIEVPPRNEPPEPPTPEPEPAEFVTHEEFEKVKESLEEQSRQISESIIKIELLETRMTALEARLKEEVNERRKLKLSVNGRLQAVRKALAIDKQA
jgi:hypothetical protein